MFKKILPHINIVLSVIFLVLWTIDRFNSAVHFLARDDFKIPFMIFLLLVLIQSVLEVARQLRVEERRAERERQARRERRRGQEEP